jgi:hypothetical protein
VFALEVQPESLLWWAIRRNRYSTVVVHFHVAARPQFQGLFPPAVPKKCMSELRFLVSSSKFLDRSEDSLIITRGSLQGNEAAKANATPGIERET